MGWYRGKRTVEACLKLDGYRVLSDLRDISFGYSTVTWSRNDEKFSSISIRKSEDKVRLEFIHNKTEEIKQDVSLTRTAQPHGGYRNWFLCPYCQRRIAKLYCGKYFACRKCHDLTYVSCNESHKFDNLFRQMGAKLGEDPRMVRVVLDEGRELRKIERRHRRREYMQTWRQKRKVNNWKFLRDK